MMDCRDYRKPASLNEAIDLLRTMEGEVLLLAGGTEYLVNAREVTVPEQNGDRCLRHSGALPNRGRRMDCIGAGVRMRKLSNCR
jgi:CO/xanthine dehydrogenase FAD-binding subunit